MFLRIESLLNRVAQSTPLRLSLLWCLALLSAWPALRQAGALNQHYDAQFLLAYEEHARITLREFGQLPLWDPYTCGGLYGLAAPQTRYASPTFLLSLLLGVPAASSVLAVLLPALGMEGMFRYARRWGAGPLASLAFAPAFPLIGFFSFAWGFGWVQFYSFALVPWILSSLRQALRGEAKGAFACAVWVAATVGMGGTYTLPMLVLPGLVELGNAMQCRGELCAPRKQLVLDALRGTLVTALLVASIAAFRLWPMLESAPATLRVMGSEAPRALAWLLRTLGRFATTDNQVDGRYFVAPTLLLGALCAFRREYVLLTGLGALSFGLAFGETGPYAPFTLMRRLPVYETLRHPERFLLLFALALSLLSAVSATRLGAFVRDRKGARAAAVAVVVGVLLAVAGSLTQAMSNHVRYADVRTEPVSEYQGGAFKQSRGNRWLVAHYAPLGLGSLGCGEAYPVPMSQRLRGDLTAEEYLVDAEGEPLDVGTVEREYWSPNEIRLHVTTPTEARLAINQNFHPGFVSDVGRVVSWEGLLAVDLPAGEQRVTVRFRPRSGIGGMLTSLVGLIGGIVFAFASRKALRGAGLAAGPICFALLFVVWPEAAFERPEPRTADHRPVVLEEMPAAARAIEARFDVPLVLTGAALPRDVQGDVVDLELFFRREGKLGPEHALFVHIDGPARAHVGADHAALSGLVYLPRMPVGAVVRDAFRVPLPRGKPGRYRVHVGLYDSFGDGHRRRVVSTAEGVDTRDHAVLVGEFEVKP